MVLKTAQFELVDLSGHNCRKNFGHSSPKRTAKRFIGQLKEIATGRQWISLITGVNNCGVIRG